MIKSLEVGLRFKTLMNDLPIRLGDWLINLCHRTIERAEHKANQHRIMENEFIRVMRTGLQRTSVLRPLSSPSSLSDTSLSSPLLGLRRFEHLTHQLGLGLQDPKHPLNDQLHDSQSPLHHLNSHSHHPTPLTSFSPTTTTNTTTDSGLSKMKFRQLLHTFAICLIFQIYWTSVNLISWFEITITQLAYRLVIAISPDLHQRPPSTSSNKNSPSLGRELPSKPLKISITSKPILSSIIKPFNESGLSSNHKNLSMPNRVMRNVSWDSSPMSLSSTSALDPHSSGSRPRSHLHHKDSKILPKSPKPILPEEPVIKPKLQKMTYGLQSRSPLDHQVLQASGSDHPLSDQEDHHESGSGEDEDEDGVSMSPNESLRPITPELERVHHTNSSNPSLTSSDLHLHHLLQSPSSTSTKTLS